MFIHSLLKNNNAKYSNSYFNCLNNMIAYGFFEKCDSFSKQCKILSHDKFVEVYKVKSFCSSSSVVLYDIVFDWSQTVMAVL